MIEVWLFGFLVYTLGSALALFLVVTALGSVAYLGFTLAGTLTGPTGGRARSVAFASGTLLGLGAALAGIRVGGAFETLVVALATALASGGVASLAWSGTSRSLRSLGEARRERTKLLAATEASERGAEDAARLAFLQGDDIDAEVREAQAAVDRLRAAHDRLKRTEADVENKLAAEGPLGRDSELAQDLARTREDVRGKVELGARVLRAAELAAYRIACNAPLRLLLRRRPPALSDSARDLARLPGHAERLSEVLRGFLRESHRAKERLLALPAFEIEEDKDPRTIALRDVDALAEAYAAVVERVEVVRLERVAHAEMSEVATAAGALSKRAKTSGLDPSDLSALVGEVTRAELVLSAANRPERDGHALTLALTRSAVTLDREESSTVDDLLSAMRELD
jgi:hypothetical protein